MTLRSFVPDGFRYSYILPIPKIKDKYSKSLICDDFRAIAISQILSKVFEYCILKRYETFLVSSDNQFGFKKKVSGVVMQSEQFAADLCTIDISNVFDRVNHFALLIKLMKRLLPVQ